MSGRANVESTKCCGCCSKEEPRRRRKIKQISQPLRPDELNQILAQYGFLDDQKLPAAWVGPYPKTTSAAVETVQPPRPGSLPSRIGPPTAPKPVPLTTASSSTEVPLHVHTLSAGQSTNAQNHCDYSPLAYSLSAELASVGKHRFRLTYVTDRLLVVNYPPDAQEVDHNEGARWLCQAFERRYGNNYRIFNLSGFTKELHLSSQVPVIDLFWPVPLAPGLEQLVTAIDQLDFWLHNHDNCVVNGQDPRIHTNRVAVLHCTGPRSLLATFLAVYICQSKARFGPLCGQRPGSPTARGLQWTENRFKRFKHELVLGHMILKRFYEDNLARELIPSQKRYVGYFSGLVTGALILQDRLVWLHSVVFRNPNRGRYYTGTLETIVEQNGNGNSLYAHPDDLDGGRTNVWEKTAGAKLNGWKSFDPLETSMVLGNWERSKRDEERGVDVGKNVEHWKNDDQIHTTVKGFVNGEGGFLLKIYQNLKLMHTSKLLCPNVDLAIERYIFPIEPILPLHGDILISCYLRPFFAATVQEIVFRLQFHTCALSNDKFSFYKHDLDEACSDTRFPPTGCVELYFTSDHKLLQEHQENLNCGAYTWTSAERESTIIGVSADEDESLDIKPSLSVKDPLNIYINSSSGGPGLGDWKDTSKQMWSDTGIPGRPGERIPRLPLVRQVSDPLAHQLYRGRSLPTDGGVQWSGPPPDSIPLFQQALLSPRAQPSRSDLIDSTGISGQIGRLNVTQLQQLYQQLLQQQEQLNLRQTQQRVVPQPAIDPSGVYATVQRPPGANLATLLNTVQQALSQQQQQPQWSFSTAMPFSQQISPVASNSGQLLSSLTTSTALTNLARALLPTAATADQSGLRPGTYGQFPQNAGPTLQMTPQGLAYAREQRRISTGVTPGSTTDQDLERICLELLAARSAVPPQQAPISTDILRHLLEQQQKQSAAGVSDIVEQPRRMQLQRDRMALNDQERRLFEELRELRQRRAEFQRQDLQNRLDLTPLESYRRATGRTTVSESGRGRGARLLQAAGRTGSADAARVPQSDLLDAAEAEDAALLSLLEQRLARIEARQSQATASAGLGDIPVKAVGPQQRSGHVVDGSSRAILGDSAVTGSAVRVFLPAEPTPPAANLEPPRTITPRIEEPAMQPSPGDYATLSDVVSPYLGMNGLRDAESELITQARQPRIHLHPESIDVGDFGYPQQHYGRTRPFSRSPTNQPPVYGPPSRSNLMPLSPAQRLRPWGQTSYDEQIARARSRHYSDVSPGVSPSQTPSSRLLRSPTSPAPRSSAHDRRLYTGLETGSQSDTGLIMDYTGRGWGSRHGDPSRRGYRYRRPDAGRHQQLPLPPQRPWYRHERPSVSPTPVVEGHGPLEHVPESALITLNRLSASANIWYRPDISRTHAVDLVRSDPPGTFVVRNSGSFQKSFGLVVKVVRSSEGSADDREPVRHYLIEGIPASATVMAQAIGVSSNSLAPCSVPMSSAAMSVTQGAVLLRGCSAEPIFTNLVSLLYEHAIQPLALPVTLRLPFKTLTPIANLPSLIALSRGDGDNRTRMYRSHLGTSYPDESPRGPSALHPNGGGHRGLLTRHPSDPLPGGDFTMAGSSGCYYSAQSSSMPPPHQRMEGPRTLRGRSSPSQSTYETEHGPISYSGRAGKWKTFTAVYLGSIDTENLTGASAIRKAVDVLLDNASQVKQTEVNLKVAHDGLTVTDNWRKLFFRRHYPFFSVSHCSIDPDQRCWDSSELRAMGLKASKIFGFVARKPNTRENMCHVLCDTPEFPASTITQYISYRLNEH